MPLTSIAPPSAPLLLPKTEAGLYAIPIGLIMFSPKGTVPTGWLACEGATFDTGLYPELFTYLGSSTLPDMRDRVARGAGTLAGVSGTTQEDAIQEHNHRMPLEINSGSWAAGAGGAKYKATLGDVTNPTTESIAGRFNANETRVKAYIGKFVIKAFSAVVGLGTLDITQLASTVDGKVNKADIVGTLVSGGNGRIVETGSNANGRYTKFADGTMICIHNLSPTGAIDVSFQGGFLTAASVWTYPAAFSSIPRASAAGAYAFTHLIYPNSNFSSANFYVGAVAAQAAAARPVDLIAIGRWF